MFIHEITYKNSRKKFCNNYIFCKNLYPVHWIKDFNLSVIDITRLGNYLSTLNSTLSSVNEHR